MFAVSTASVVASAPALRPRAARRAVPVSRVVTVRAQKEEVSEVTRRDAMIGAAASVVLLSASPARAIDVGATAPGFTLPSTGGGSVTLADVVKANKYTVLYFYNQDFSQGCSIEAERFNQALGDFAKRNAQVVGVSMDPLEKHEEFCTAKGLGFKLLSDGDGSVSASYGADLKIPILVSWLQSCTGWWYVVSFAKSNNRCFLFLGGDEGRDSEPPTHTVQPALQRRSRGKKNLS